MARINWLLSGGLVLLAITWLPAACFAQVQPQKHIPVVRYGDLDTLTTSPLATNKPTTTWKQVLANTKLTCAEPGCRVTGFTISFLPKGMEYRGPYITKDRADLKEETVELLKKELVGNARCRVFIEAIHVSYNGVDIKLPKPLMFTVTN